MSTTMGTAPSLVPLMTPWFDNAEAIASAEALALDHTERGSKVGLFEEAFAAAVGAPYAVAVSSGTAALHVALLAAGVGPGDQVIVPSAAFVSTAEAVMYVGATPVFADVDPATGTITGEEVGRLITSVTRAVIAVDHAGVPVDLEGIRSVVDPFGAVVIEDASCAAGSTYRGRSVGVGADIAAWSFHRDMPMTAGEGGMLTTNRADWAARARRLREHGALVPAMDRQSATSFDTEYGEVGYDYRMTDIHAAIGIVQLTKLVRAVRRRREIAARYRAAIRSGEHDLRAVGDPEYGTGNVQSFWVELGDGYPTDRDGLLAAFAAAGLASRRGGMAVHRQLPYRDLAPEGSLPVTEHLADSTVILPIYHSLTEQDQDRVIDVLLAPPKAARR